MTIFNTQPTCGEISCDQCNERYEKAMERVKALEDVVRELVTNGKAAINETGYPVTHMWGGGVIFDYFGNNSIFRLTYIPIGLYKSYQ